MVSQVWLRYSLFICPGECKLFPSWEKALSPSAMCMSEDLKVGKHRLKSLFSPEVENGPLPTYKDTETDSIFSFQCLTLYLGTRTQDMISPGNGSVPAWAHQASLVSF